MLKTLTRLTLSLALIVMSHTAMAKKPPVGDMAPDFTLASNGQHNLRLSEQRGYVIVVVFWASWCRSCPQQMQDLQTLQAKYQEYGVKLWAISLDKKRQDAIDHNKHHYAGQLNLLFDDSFIVSERYDIDDLPSSIIIDRDGRIRHLQDGYHPSDVSKFDTLLQTLVTE